MTLPLFALIVSFPQSSAPAKADASAAELIGACFKRYYDAKSAAGRIHLTQSAQNVTIAIDTDLAYDRPSELYISQRRNGNQPGKWLAASDGNTFSYNKPGQIHGPARLREAVAQADGRIQTVPEMYAALGGPGSLGDRSPILDIAIGNPDVLAGLKSHWTELKRLGTNKVGDQEVNVITGKYCAIVGQEPTGSFEMDLSPEGDIVRFILTNRYAARNNSGGTVTVDVISNWETDLKVGVKNDQKVYQTG